MKFTDIKPFVRHTHKIALGADGSDKICERCVVPRDNRLFFCADGEGIIASGDNVYKMSRGDSLLLPAGTKYIIRTPKSGVSYICVNFDYTFSSMHERLPAAPVPTEDFSAAMIIERAEFECDPELNKALYLQKTHIIERKLGKMLYAYRKRLIYCELELSSVFAQILTELLRCERLTALAEKGSLFDRISEYVHANYHLHITNRAVAAELGYNPNYISDLTRAATGFSLHKYLTHVRLERAIELIEWSDKSVGEIAELCGFYDIYHFSKAFKAATGISPAKYRK